MIEIVNVSTENLCDVNITNHPFEVIGRIKPQYADGIWTYEEELYEKSYMKHYPNDEEDYSTYIDNNDKTIFLAYSEAECIGQIVLRKDWNLNAFIEDISVSDHARGMGVGSALINEAKKWALKSGLHGLALETQDNNLKACRFYKKCGFEIGAVNSMLYKNFEKPWSDEIAIFWYLRF